MGRIHFGRKDRYERIFQLLIGTFRVLFGIVWNVNTTSFLAMSDNTIGWSDAGHLSPMLDIRGGQIAGVLITVTRRMRPSCRESHHLWSEDGGFRGGFRSRWRSLTGRRIVVADEVFVHCLG